MIKLSIEVKGGDLFELMEKRMRPAMRSGMEQMALQWEGMSKTQGWNESGLVARTGTLRRSISSYYEQVGNYTMAGVYSNVVYARIHELGGEYMPKKSYIEAPMHKNWATLLNTAADEIIRIMEK
jgi:phage gpG-like protein